MIRIIQCICFGLVLFAGAVSTAASDDESDPNVLLIVVDDLNDWIGCLGGHPQAKTPNIDRLAKAGILFENAHCQGPICGPSRASIWSGSYPHTTGVYQQPASNSLTEDEKFFKGQLLPEYFSRNGYETFAVGKVTHGYRNETAFDYYGGKFDGAGPKPAKGRRFNYFLPDVPFTGTQTDWGPFPDQDEKMPDYRSADWASEVLTQTHDRPFFLAVGFNRPHVPWYVPEKWFAPFPLDEIVLPAVMGNDLEDVPEIGVKIHELPKYPSLEFLQANGNEQFKKCVQAYLACNYFVDHQVGRVLKSLEQSAYADNTIVILFSDHGYHLGEKSRVSKHSLWEESTRVPFMILPSRDSELRHKVAGRKSSKPVELIDLYPTLTEMCGLPSKASNEGRSLKPLMEDPSIEWRFSALTTYARKNHSLRTERYRYIRYENGAEELYDHQFDPEEWENIAGDPEQAELIFRFRLEVPRRNAKYHAATKKRPINPWFQSHLKANGIE
jgi:arylsulfatase A-like enzyme